MTNPLSPLVSIVITSYNQPELLGKAIESVLHQTYSNIEIIIVDDCSTDPKNKALILQYYALYPQKIKYLFHPTNIGISKNKNSGFRSCNGAFISYLDGDDYYLPEKIEIEINKFFNEPDLGIVYSNFNFIDTNQNDAISTWASTPLPEGFIFEDIVKENFPNKILFRFELIRKEVFDKLGYYDETLKIYEDWDFRIRYCQQYKIGYTNKVASIYRRNNHSITIRSGIYQLIEQKKLVLNNCFKSNNLHTKAMNNWYLENIKTIELEQLYDVNLSFTQYFKLAVKSLWKHPLQMIGWLKAVKHYLKTNTLQH